MELDAVSNPLCLVGRPSTANPFIIPVVLAETVTTAEIIWAIKNVSNGHSKRSVDDDVETFKKMFSDSRIAQKMTMCRTKLSYVLTYGLAPYFRDSLHGNLKSCRFIVVCFDEALNKIVQRGQMDIHVR